MSIEYKFTEEGMELDKIIERLSEKINWQMSIEKNPFARIMPLPKNLFIRIADEVVESRTTACISNLGKIQMPPEFERYIRQLDCGMYIRGQKSQTCRS